MSIESIAQATEMIIVLHALWGRTMEVVDFGIPAVGKRRFAPKSRGKREREGKKMGKALPRAPGSFQDAQIQDPGKIPTTAKSKKKTLHMSPDLRSGSGSHKDRVRFLK